MVGHQLGGSVNDVALAAITGGFRQLLLSRGETPDARSLRSLVAFHIPQRQIVTVTTNVPGPRTSLFGLGRRVEQIVPYVPIAELVRSAQKAG